MAEIRRIPGNGLRAISLFSGGGGSSCGYRMAGFDVVWASEFVEAARETYAANWPSTTLDGRDVREVSADEILRVTGLKAGELDVLDGSPPCASFSEVVRHNAKIEDLWGKEKDYSGQRQRTDDLFDHYLRILEGLKPRAFVAENVLGLVVGRAKGHFVRILERMQRAGYRVKVGVVDAKWLGVPQHRERTIFVGMREDLGVDPELPKPFPRMVTLREALAGVTVTDEERASLSFEGMAIYESWKKLAPGRRPDEKHFNLRRCSWDMPAFTLISTAGNPGAGSIAHPEEPRKFSIAELKRICSFPDDYVLTGRHNQQVERMGRAVPPLMMRAIATAVRERLAASDAK